MDFYKQVNCMHKFKPAETKFLIQRLPKLQIVTGCQSLQTVEVVINFDWKVAKAYKRLKWLLILKNDYDIIY